MKIDRFAGFPAPGGGLLDDQYRKMDDFFRRNRHLPEAELRQKAANLLGIDPADWDVFYAKQDWDPDYNPDRRARSRYRFPMLWFLLLLNVGLGFWLIGQRDLLTKITGACSFMAAGFVAGTISTLIIKERL